MNSKNLEKSKKLIKILEGHMFEWKYTIDDWVHCYYTNTFDGRIDYDIECDELRFIDDDEIDYYIYYKDRIQDNKNKLRKLFVS